MPQKPTKWGIKAFTLADAANGYMLNSLVYTGAQTLGHADPAYTSLLQPARVVMDIMGQYLDKGYHVFTDRYVYVQGYCLVIQQTRVIPNMSHILYSTFCGETV